MTISGSGIVNFDSNDQKYNWNKQRDVERCSYKNVSFGKGRYYKKTDGENEFFYKVPIISADCIRHAIYEDEMSVHLPNIMHDDNLLLNAIASPAFLERGYMFPRSGKTQWKRKSPLSISYAKGIDSSVSSLETFSNSQEKNVEKSEEGSETSFFKREVRGDTTYECLGAIDISELGFISMSEVHDRLSFDSDYCSKYSDKLSKRLGSDIPQSSFFIKDKDLYCIPEQGIKLTEEQVKMLVTDIVKRLCLFSVSRCSTGFAKTTELKVKFVNNAIEDLIDNEEGWVTVFDSKKIDLSCFDSQVYESNYTQVDLIEQAKQEVDSYKKKYGYTEEKKKSSTKTKKKSNKETDEESNEDE